MRGELEAQQSAGRSDRTSLTQRLLKILQIDLHVLGSASQKVGEVVQKSTTCRFGCSCHEIRNRWRRFALSCQFVSTKTEKKCMKFWLDWRGGKKRLPSNCGTIVKAEINEISRRPLPKCLKQDLAAPALTEQEHRWSRRRLAGHKSLLVASYPLLLLLCPLRARAGVWPAVRVQNRSISSVISWSPWQRRKRSALHQRSPSRPRPTGRP